MNETFLKEKEKKRKNLLIDGYGYSKYIFLDQNRFSFIFQRNYLQYKIKIFYNG